MRWTMGLAILLWIAPAGFAQDGGEEQTPEPKPKENGSEKGAPDGGAKPDDGADAGDPDAKKPQGPEEPKPFKLEERDRKKVEKELSAFLIPSRKTRAEEAEGIRKLDEKGFDGKSLMEDVPTLVDIANHARVFGSKIGRPGSMREVKVPPEVHGFPGGVGTVSYWIRLPKDYRDRELWPVIFCLPDTKAWPDTADYIKQVWMKSETAKQKYIVVVPTPSAKGKQWRTDEISYARAMITLRHVLGTFDADKKDGGPASDTLRVFIDGEDTAAAVAARFSEMFAGAVLRDATGSSGRVKLRESGGLNGLPAYCVVPPSKKRQSSFADALKTANEASVIVESENPADADPEQIAKWMEGIGKRGIPRSIRYTVHDSSFQRHHWINVLRYDGTQKEPVEFEAVADRAENVVTIRNRGLVEFEVYLNDAIIDLNRELTVVVEEGDDKYVAWKGKVSRDLGAMLTELIDSNQPWRIYPARVLVRMPAVRAEAKAAAAKKAAAEAAAKDTEDKGASAETTAGSLDR